MTKTTNIAVTVLSALAFLLTFFPLASGERVVVAVMHVGGVYVVLYGLPVLAGAAAVMALYGKSINEKWWYVAVGSVGLLLALGIRFAAFVLLAGFDDTSSSTFAGYALLFLYFSITLIGLLQIALTWRARLVAANVAQVLSTDLIKVENMTATEALTQAFVGSNKYVGRWYGIFNRSGIESLPNVHVPVLLVGASWFFYRKMYVFGILTKIAELLIGFLVGGLIGITLETTDTGFTDTGFISFAAIVTAFILIRIPLCIIVDQLYLARALKFIALSNPLPATDDSSGRSGDILNKGGTSPLAVFIFLVAMIGLKFLFGPMSG